MADRFYPMTTDECIDCKSKDDWIERYSDVRDRHAAEAAAAIVALRAEIERLATENEGLNQLVQTLSGAPVTHEEIRDIIFGATENAVLRAALDRHADTEVILP